MKNVTNSFKQELIFGVRPGNIGVYNGYSSLKYVAYKVPIDPFSNTNTESETYRKMRDQIDLEIRQAIVRIRHSWLYFPDDRTEIERICDGIDMGVRPARSTLDNWQYKCITDNARSAMGLGEN